MKKVECLSCLFLLFCLFCFPAPAQINGSLEAGFKNPPVQARPGAFWHWMYGNITKEGITKDLEMMHKLGIGEVSQFHNAWVKDDGRRPPTPQGPVRFMSKEYRELFLHAVKECDRLGMKIGAQICEGFSQSGGPWITPENGMRHIKVVSSAIDVNHSLKDSVPEHTIAVIAYPVSQAGSSNTINVWNFVPANGVVLNGDSCIDLTKLIQHDRTISWKPSNGRWTVFTFYHVVKNITNNPASPEGTGLECNKLDHNAVDVILDNYLGKLIQDAGELTGKTFNHILIDSWECGLQSYTEDFISAFKIYKGYDPVPFLPVLNGTTVKNQEVSNRFLFDYRGTLGYLLGKEYYGYLNKYANKKGMSLQAESLYGGQGMPGSPLTLYGICDVPVNEIWMGRNVDMRAFTGSAASAAHVYGKRIIKDESFTVGGGSGDFSNVPSTLKPIADFNFCRGTNSLVLHCSVHQPYDDKPGWTHGWNGVNFHRGNTWWEKSQPFISYLSRCQYLLQQGLFVADVCQYVGDEDTYSNKYDELAINDLPQGYRADNCDNEALLSMEVKNGRLVLPDGMSYGVLLLSDKRTMSPEIVNKLLTLVQNGATVVGPKPQKAPGLTGYPDCDRLVREGADKLWGENNPEKVNRTLGKGKIISGETIEKILQEKHLIPDFTFTTNKNQQINFIHRQLPGSDIYFISNAGDACQADCRFRITGKKPRLWNPLTGEITGIAVYDTEKEATRIPLTFEKEGSAIVVFVEGSEEHISNITWENKPVFCPGQPLDTNFPFSFNDFSMNKKGDFVMVSSKNTENLKVITSAGETHHFPVKTNPDALNISKNWTVDFEPGRGAPGQIKSDTLISWTSHSDKGVNYFSGTASYKTQIFIPKTYLKTELKTELDLGEVKELAEVLINGQSIGILWNPPFVAEITGYLVQGKNELEIRITNTWVNRLIGDKNTPKDQQICRIYSPDPKWYTASSKLSLSGLLGPVVIRPSEIVTLKTKH
jgi:hypothetical protein